LLTKKAILRGPLENYFKPIAPKKKKKKTKRKKKKRRVFGRVVLRA